MAHLFITPDALLPQLTRPDAPALLDVRTEEDARADPSRLPGAHRLTLAEVEVGAGPDGPSVVYCQKGGKISQLAAAMLRDRGIPAQTLIGGHLAWQAASLPTTTLDLPDRWVMPMDAAPGDIAALWLLRRLISPLAPVLAVERTQVAAAAQVWDATVLPDGAGGLAQFVALSHPVLIDLDAATLASLGRVLRGRLARTGDPATALDLIDDLLAGATA